MTTSEKRDLPYKLKFMPEALEEWAKLDGAAKAQLKKVLERRLQEPRVPASALSGPLAGCYKIKLKAAGLRLVYAVDNGELCVLVLSVGKRDDMAAYTAAMRRLVR